jgi:hypothetical protein
MANILFAGWLYNNAGAPIEVATETDVTTSPTGYWALTESTAGRYDVKITSGSSIRYIKYDTSAQMTALEVLNLRIRTADFNASYDIVPADIASDYSLTLPLITASDTFAVLGFAQTFSAAQTFTSTVTVGANTDGNDVKFFGDSSGAYILWDTSADKLLTAGGAVVDIVKDKLLIGGTAVTTTAAELNIIDGGTSATGTTLVAADRVVVNDNGTMVQVAMSDFETFMESNLDTLGSVTSLGTLTALQVDYINANASTLTITDSSDTGDYSSIVTTTHGATTITTVDDDAAAANFRITADGTVDIDSVGVLTLDSGAAINIEPAAGSAILLDGTISVDAGVVTGASSITSTAFVGTLSTAAQGNVTSLGPMTGLRLVDDGAIAFGTTNGTDWDMYHDGSDMYMQKNTGGLMIALSASPPAPDRDVVHIWNGTSGTGDPPSDRADLIIEDNGHVGIALLCPNDATGFIYFADEDDIDIGQIAYDHNAERMQLRAGNTTGLLITGAGNIQIGDVSVRGTTVGTNTLAIFNGTAPVGTLSNGASFYSASGQMRVIQADGTATDVSPHNPVTGEWWHNSEQTVTGKHTRIHMERLVRFLDNHFGTDFLEEWMEETNGN